MAQHPVCNHRDVGTESVLMILSNLNRMWLAQGSLGCEATPCP